MALPRIILTYFALLLINGLFGQSDSLNQYDANGKKHGKWILYLDWKGAKLPDSSNAAYFRYTYYDHGIHIQPMGNFISKGGRIEATENHPNPGAKIKMLDGEYKCLDAKGKVKFIHVFKDGEYVSYKEFYPSGELHTYFDYTKHAQGQPHSWYLYEYSKDGKVKYEDYTAKDENGNWPKMRG